MSPDSTTARSKAILSRGIFLSALLLLCIASAGAQRVAILTPDNGSRSTAYASELSSRFGRPFKVLDSDLSGAAFRSIAGPDPFNMTVQEARTIAAAIGCDYFILVRADGLRRTSLGKGEYYEAFAFFYIVDGRTGDLISWSSESFERDTQTKADEALRSSADANAAKLENVLREFIAHTATVEKRKTIEEVPMEGTSAAAGLKPPIPYKRIKPGYPSIAFLYEVKATIDVEADIGAGGEVLAIKVVRWAGFDLEASVQKTIREMNWRPAMRNGKALPMRILLRYNFTKVDKDP
jgi:hypothetical protein